MIVPSFIPNITIAIICGITSILSQSFATSDLICENVSIQVEYPGKVSINSKGKCYIATRDIEPGSFVERFEGPCVKYEEIPLEEICYAGCHGDGFWTIPLTNARYINHSCDPNCDMNSNGDVYAIRFIKAGEEITFDYVTISKERYLKAPQEYFWDPRWSFDCLCGSSNCHKQIDHYIIKE